MTTTAARPDVESHSSNCAPYPHIFYRTFACGHPEEFVEIRSLENGERIHNLVSLQIFEECSRAGKRPTYVQARCLDCARKAKEQDDNNPCVQPSRTLTAYRSGTSSTYKSSVSREVRDGFDGILARRKEYSDQVKVTKLHTRVSEESHRVYRDEVLKAALESPGTWLALPVRRVTNAPVRTRNEPDVETRLKEMLCPFDGEYKALLPAKIEGTKIHALEDGSQEHQTGLLSSTLSVYSGTKGTKRPGNAILLKTDPGIGKRSDDDFFEDASKSEGSLHLAVESTPSLSRPSLSQEYRFVDGGNPVTNRGETFCPGGVAELHTTNEKPTQYLSKSIFTEHIDSILLDDSVSPCVEKMSYGNPRPAPLVPRRSLLGFRKRRSSTGTKTSRHSESGSKHLRKLSLDIFLSGRSFGKREAKDRSPDWACRTSLAIGAGRMSIDGGRTSVSSMYSSEARPNSSELVSIGLSRRERIKNGLAYGAQSLPLSGYSPVPSTLDRHSEGALQSVQRASATSLVRGPETWERGSREEQSRRHQFQAISTPNLNKNLPALPLLGDEAVNWL